MVLFYFFALIVVWLGIKSLQGGVRFLSYVHSELNKELPAFTPFASIIAPCRGLDQGLRENLGALFMQDYPAYEIIFVTEDAHDPALFVIEEARKAFAGKSEVIARVVHAGRATESGQKVHNLIAAVGEASGSSNVFVFVDTDARPQAHWLRTLVAPLADERMGAATGYRWFIPVNAGLASHLRAVWNASIASALGEREDRNFCWGGSTAIRRATFEKLNMRERWRGTLSDDFTMMRVLRKENLPIHFVPQCLTPSLEDCTVRELFEFTTRQLKITRVYAPGFWKAILTGSLLFTLIFFGGLALVITRAALGLSYLIPLALLIIIFALGAAKAYVRLLAVSLPLSSYRAELRKGLLAHLFLWPVASALYLYNALCAAFSRRILWRGIAYELKSPTETVIISSQHSVVSSQ
ncbi:MAG: glycosyltransferase [Pyrinomonadaceae bacterium]